MIRPFSSWAADSVCFGPVSSLLAVKKLVRSFVLDRASRSRGPRSFRRAHRLAGFTRVQTVVAVFGHAFACGVREPTGRPLIPPDTPQGRPRMVAGTALRCGKVPWRCRESNPGPLSPFQGFSVRSSLCLYSAPPVTRTSRCDGPSHCLFPNRFPWPEPAVSLLADAGEPGRRRSRADRLRARSGGEGEVALTIRLGAYI